MKFENLYELEREGEDGETGWYYSTNNPRSEGERLTKTNHPITQGCMAKGF